MGLWHQSSVARAGAVRELHSHWAAAASMALIPELKIELEALPSGKMSTSSLHSPCTVTPKDGERGPMVSAFTFYLVFLVFPNMVMYNQSLNEPCAILIV